MKKLILIFIASFLAVAAFSQQKYYNAQEYRHSPTDTVSALQKNGNVIYQASANKLYVRLAGVWRPFTTTVGGGTLSFGLANQTPVVNATVNDFTYSANYSYDITNNNFRAARSFTNTNSGTQNNNTVIGESSQFLGTHNIRWAFLATEQGIVNAAGGLIHNPTIQGGFNNGISTAGTAQSFSCGIFNSNNSAIQAITGVTTSSMIFSGRNDTIQNSSIAFASGYRAKVTKDGAFLHGFFDTYANGTHTGTIRSCKNDGRHSFGFFTNTSASNDSTGIWADYSFALGGLNPYIPSTSPRSGILGGQAIYARANDPDQIYSPNFNIDTEPTRNDTLDQVIVRNRSDKRGQLQWRDASTLGGSGISGLTTNRVTYATSATTIGDDSRLIWDSTNDLLGIGATTLTATATLGHPTNKYVSVGAQSVDGSDDMALILNSYGGSTQTTTRGSSIFLAGNENATFTGKVLITPGNVSGSSIDMYNNAGVLALTLVGSTGNLGLFAANSFDTGVGVIGIRNATTQPAAGDPNQVMVYAKDDAGASSKLWITDEAGNSGMVPIYLEGSATLDFGSIAAGATETLTVTVNGAADGDQVTYGIPATAKTAGLVFGQAWVSSSNTVSVEAYNSTGSPIDPNSATFKVKVFK